MSTAVTQPAVSFPDGYDERGELEAAARGYLSHVIVRLEDGTRYQLAFWDPARLGQDVETEADAGRPYVAEPNMVVVPEVTRAGVLHAVHGLWRERYFEQLRPLNGEPAD